MKKIGFIVEKIEEEPNPQGTTLLRVTARSGGKLFILAAKKADYLDERKRLSIHRTWMKTIKARMDEANRDEKQTKADAKTINALVGKGFEEEDI